MLSSFVDAHPGSCASVEATAPLTKHYAIFAVVLQPFASLRPLTVEAPPFRGWGRDFCCLRHLPVWYHCLIKGWESEMSQPTASQTARTVPKSSLTRSRALHLAALAHVLCHACRVPHIQASLILCRQEWR